MGLSAGTKLGRYEVRAKIGEGGMGVVYRARDEKLNRDIAIKVLPAAFSDDVERLHRFEQEAQAAGALNHPNILSVYDVATHDGAPYVVSELLEGETLRERLRNAPISERKAIDYAIQIARGLAAAHEKGIVHRDVKPDTEVAIESIAVLPFQNRSTEPDSEYLSDGLAESLIYRLSQLPNLKVSPTSTVFRYKGKEIDPIKVGQELGVSAVLSGRIVQRGDQLTISAELVDVRHNRLLWGEQYDRKLSDLLQTQREIAREIVDKLKLKVSGEEKGFAKHYTESNEAYQLYLKGRFYWNKRTGESIKKSIEYFSQAIEKDPSFALAYAGLADSYVVPANRLPPREAMPKAKAAAMRALELDETLAEAHTSLARVLAAYDWDWTNAEKEYKRALELNPRYAIAHQWYGAWFQVMGRSNEAIAERKLAQELDPLSLIINFELGLAFYYARDYDQAIEQFQKTLELDQNFPPAQQFLPAAYEQKRMYGEAIAGFKKAVPLTKGSEWSLTRGGLGHVYSVSGKKSEARTVLDELLKQLSGPEYVSAPGIALIYAGLGEKDPAFA